MNAIDIEVAVRTLYGECRGCPPIGQQAVAHVIINRLQLQKWGTTLTQVCLAHAQFSCWLQTDLNYKIITSVADADPVLTSLRAVLQAAIDGEADPTGGATFYYAIGIKPPEWAVGATPCGQFGHQLFFKNVE